MEGSGFMAERYGCSSTKKAGGENTEKLYLRSGLGGSDVLLVDPEKLTLALVD